VGARAVAAALAALQAGEAVLLPTDGVYGLCALPEREASVQRLYALKGREAARPAAVIAASVELLLERVPELAGRSELILRALLPGPYTLVLANPARRYPWLNRERPEAIGVRVAELPPDARAVLGAVGLLAATSANLSGEPAAASLEQLPAALRAGCGAEIDGGRLPGTASTVIDFSRGEPAVLRSGAGPVEPALALAARALAASS
jgi:L-threonylcarbamoyladenylate synthase